MDSCDCSLTTKGMLRATCGERAAVAKTDQAQNVRVDEERGLCARGQYDGGAGGTCRCTGNRCKEIE